MKLKRTLTLTVAAPVLALALVGCADGETGDADDRLPGSTASATQDPTDTEATTEAPEAEEPEAEAPAAGTEVTPEQFRALFKKATEQLTTAKVRSEGEGVLASEMSGVVDYTSTPPSMEFTSKAGGAETRTIMVDGALFMNMGPATGNKWMKTELEQTQENTDPLAAMDEFMKSIKSVTFVGEEQVEGGDADHYTVTLRPDAGGSAPSAPQSMTLDFWFDDQGRPVIMGTSMKVNGKKASTKMIYSDFGTKVSIKAPPADQVTTNPMG